MKTHGKSWENVLSDGNLANGFALICFCEELLQNLPKKGVLEDGELESIGAGSIRIGDGQ